MYSGKGVSELREFLVDSYNALTDEEKEEYRKYAFELRENRAPPGARKTERAAAADVQNTWKSITDAVSIPVVKCVLTLLTILHFY